MKIIIIGSIAAGVSAAARLAAAQRGAQITVYEKGGFYSCGTGGLPHYLCEDLDSLNKAIQAKETELNAQGITAHLRHEVRGIDAAARKVTVCDLATGRVFEDHYDKLVLATGSSNRVPQVPGSDRVGVQTLKTVEDLIFLKEFVRTPYVRDIVILVCRSCGATLPRTAVWSSAAPWPRRCRSTQARRGCSTARRKPSPPSTRARSSRAMWWSSATKAPRAARACGRCSTPPLRWQA